MFLLTIHHYNNIIMSTMASQITSLMIVYSTVYSGADQRKHQSSTSLAFVQGIHRSLVNSLHKWPVTRKMFPFDDIIMSCKALTAIYLQDNIPHFPGDEWQAKYFNYWKAVYHVTTDQRDWQDTMMLHLRNSVRIFLGKSFMVNLRKMPKGKTCFILDSLVRNMTLTLCFIERKVTDCVLARHNCIRALFTDFLGREIPNLM